MSNPEIPQPYLGISGVAHYEQHVALFDIAAREEFDRLGRFMMIGVQATGKTQVLDIENSRGRLWHPVGGDIADAAANEDSGLTKPFVHCYFVGEQELTMGVANVLRRTRHFVQGLQFNLLPWIDQDFRPFLSDFKDQNPNQSIVLQTGKETLDRHSPQEVADRLTSMPVDYILFDPSGGRGEEFDSEQLMTYVDEIYQRQLPFGVGVSGGLEPRNVDRLLGPMLEVYTNLSCDAEGRLRKGPEGATELDLGAAEDFIVTWKATLMSRYPDLED